MSDERILEIIEEQDKYYILGFIKEIKINRDKLIEEKEEWIKLLSMFKKQQQDFINYLEDEIKACKVISNLLFNSNKEIKVYKEILQKYKSIIGAKDE